MLHKKQLNPNTIASAFLIIFLTSCTAASRPYTLSDIVPDGPPEYQAGWHDGCESILSTANFYNSRSKFKPNLGSGIYQHDAAYNTGYTWGFNVCGIQTGDFTASPGSYGGMIGSAPLE